MSETSHSEEVDQPTEASIAAARKDEALRLIGAAIAERTASMQETAELATPHGRARRHWMLATRNVHPSRAAEVAAIISSGDSQIDQLLAVGDIVGALRAVDRLTDKLRHSGFNGPKPEVPQSMLWRPEIDALGWAPEIPALFNDQGGLLKKGQQITWLDWWGVEIDGIRHTHEEVRRRAGATSIAIVTRAEVERQAQTDFVIRERLRRIDAHQKRA
jgi:hypothetical protein